MNTSLLSYIVSAFILSLAGGCQASTPDVRANNTTATSSTASAEAGVLPREAPPPGRISKSLRESLDLLWSAPIVESFRILPTRGKNLEKGVLGYEVIARGPRLDEATTQQLTSLVFDPRRYDGQSWCGEIEPGVAFRFIGNSHTLTMLVCFKCQQWEFWLDGERLGGGTFIGVQPELLRLVQRVFPADESVRAIPSSETYGRIYRIAAFLALPKDQTDERSSTVISDWTTKIESAVGDSAEWIDSGGTKHSLQLTRDGSGVMVITTAKGHRAIAALAGVVVQSP